MNLKQLEYFVSVAELGSFSKAAVVLDIAQPALSRQVRALVLVAAPEGIALMNEKHPDVEIFTASIDSHLNDHGYIIPGLGDAGDKIFGTRHN